MNYLADLSWRLLACLTLLASLVAVSLALLISFPLWVVRGGEMLDPLDWWISEVLEPVLNRANDW